MPPAKEEDMARLSDHSTPDSIDVSLHPQGPGEAPIWQGSSVERGVNQGEPSLETAGFKRHSLVLGENLKGRNEERVEVTVQLALWKDKGCGGLACPWLQQGDY